MKFKQKGKLINILILIFSIILSALFCEQIYRFGAHKAGKQRIYQKDKIIGWKPKDNMILEKTLISSKGRKYLAKYSTNELGIKENTQLINNGKPFQKLNIVLVIGDSYTGDFYCSNNDSWFAIIQKNTPSKVYAFGNGGTGTFQQYLAFKSVVEKIKPDILILQFSANDIHNDFFEFSNKKFIANQQLRRPYFLDNKSHFRSDLISKLYRYIYDKSYIFQKVDYLIQNTLVRKLNERRLNKMSKDQINNLNIRAVKNWEVIYRMFVNYARKKGISNIISISADDFNKNSLFIESWENLSKELKIPTFKSIADVKNLKNDDYLYEDGGHLNDLGNIKAGNLFLEELKQKGLL